MRYYVCEGKPNGDYNASTKARNDCNQILENLGYEKAFVETVLGIEEKKSRKVFQYLAYKNNLKEWIKFLSRLNKGDVIVIQYPLINTTLNFEKFLKECNKKGVTTIALIHDMDSLRYQESDGKARYQRLVKEDSLYLSNFTHVICHNEKMKEKCVMNGCKSVVCLEIFDYLTDDIQYKERTKNDPVIIAGNLDINKTKYIRLLDSISDVDFNLYGVGYKDNHSSHISYKGAFLPTELLNHLEGGFGLVWDGESKDGCQGGYGNYLRFNNPHKTSMNLVAGIPVIVWEEAAIADFILKNKVGITIKSLDEIGSKIRNLSDDEYNVMLNNCKIISGRLSQGYYLQNALKRLEE